jgi:hypothetical protein
MVNPRITFIFPVMYKFRNAFFLVHKYPEYNTVNLMITFTFPVLNTFINALLLFISTLCTICICFKFDFSFRSIFIRLLLQQVCVYVFLKTNSVILTLDLPNIAPSNTRKKALRLLCFLFCRTMLLQSPKWVVSLRLNYVFLYYQDAFSAFRLSSLPSSRKVFLLFLYLEFIYIVMMLVLRLVPPP